MVELCGGKEFYMARAFSPRSFSLIQTRFGPEAQRFGDSVISVTRDGVKLSFFRHGGLLMKGAASPDEALKQTAHLMAERHIKRLPVVDQAKRLVGILSRVDVLRTMGEDYHAPTRDETVADRPVHLVGDLHQPLHAANNSDAGGTRFLVVLRKRPTNMRVG